MKDALWPEVEFYDLQWEAMVESVRRSVETVVVAGNKVGKDFGAGFTCLTFFCFPWVYVTPEYVEMVEATTPRGWPIELRHTCRVITTSAAGEHLMVLWGEVARFLETARQPMLVARGGPLILNDLQLTYASEEHKPLNDRMNYMIGQVAAKPEKFSGHHAKYNLFAVDEASSMENKFYERTLPWTSHPGGRRLLWGNAEAGENVFKKHFRAGNLSRADITRAAR